MSGMCTSSKLKEHVFWVSCLTPQIQCLPRNAATALRKTPMDLFIVQYTACDAALCRRDS